MPSPGSRLGSLPLVLLLALFSQPEPVQAGTLPSRWGHSLALVPSPEYALVIASGKLDTSGQTYTSASTTASSVVVPLGAAFSLADVDTLAYDVAAGPPYAWGSVEALGDGTGRLLTFGGDGSPVTALQTGTDSAWLYSTADGWAQQDSDWAGEPMRREGAASCSAPLPPPGPSPRLIALTPSLPRLAPHPSARPDVVLHRWLARRRLGHGSPDDLRVRRLERLRRAPVDPALWPAPAVAALPVQRHPHPARRVRHGKRDRPIALDRLHARHDRL